MYTSHSRPCWAALAAALPNVPSAKAAALLGLLSLSALAGCTDEAATGPIPPVRASAAVVPSAEEPPERGAETRLFHWGLASDSALWAEIAALDTVVSVGIKRPGERRGAWKGRFLITPSELSAGREALARIAGVRLVAADEHIPAVRLKVPNLATLATLRRLPFVDYVEPALVRVILASDSGCGAADHGGTSYQTLAAATGGLDTLPHNFVDMNIVRAWAYSTGAGMNLGLTDTGVWDAADSEFGPIHFASGMSAGRTFGQTSTTGSSAIVCSHGSRAAGCSQRRVTADRSSALRTPRTCTARTSTTIRSSPRSGTSRTRSKRFTMSHTTAAPG